MNRMISMCLGAVLLAAPCVSAVAQAGQNDNAYNSKTWSQDDATRIVQAVRHTLLTLQDYGVFDSLSFGIQGKSIVLRGYASRPTLKSDAERSVKKIPGVESVTNQIVVLPNSPNDDSIRVGVYRRVYGQPALRKYSSGPGSFGGPSIARMAGGITQDPPLGYHAIHIIVNNGHVILSGVVDSESDANIASMQANSTPGAFSVDNELMFPGATQKEK